MTRFEPFQSDLQIKSRKMLQDAGVPQCSAYVEKYGEPGQHWTVTSSDEEQSSDNTEDEDTIIYGIGSQTKPLILLLLSIIIDLLSYSEEPEHKDFRLIYPNIRNLWDVKFSVIFNHFIKLAEPLVLPRDPTLIHVALHYNSFPPMNHILLALDGTSIASKESFLRVAPILAKLAYGGSTENYIDYSNANYIYIGYLIEAIGKDSLAVLLKKHLLDPLDMNKTFMGAPDSNTHRIAQPYTISADGVLNRVDTQLYQADSVVAAAFGVWSCTRDWAKLFRAIIACLNGNDSFFKNDSLKRVLHPVGRLNDKEDATSAFGIYTTLNTSIPGCKSYNRLIAPEEEHSTYRLGYKDGKDEVNAYYLAGTTKGFACSSYLLPKRQTFVIVLTSGTAFSDASDHISRLILQKCINLSFPSKKLGSVVKILGDRSAGSRARSPPKQVDIVAMSSLAAAAGKKHLQRLVVEDADGDIPGARPIHLEGSYYNEITEQTIFIKENQAELLGTAEGAWGTPLPMGFIRTGNSSIRLHPLSDSEFTIDRFEPDCWQNLSFELSTMKFEGEEKVMCLTRIFGKFTDRFVRI